MDSDMFRGMGAVVFVLALLGAALWALRRTGGLRGSILGTGKARGSGAARLLKTLDRMALTPQHSLHLVSAGGRELLLATHPAGCTLLTDFGSRRFAAGAINGGAIKMTGSSENAEAQSESVAV